MHSPQNLLPPLRLLVHLTHDLEDILLSNRLVLILNVYGMVDMLYGFIFTLK